MLRSIRRAAAGVASLLGLAPAVAASQTVVLAPRDFAVAANAFFSLAYPFARYEYAGCSPATGVQQANACLTFAVERGIEAATGTGALRLLLTSVTAHNADVPSLAPGGFLSGRVQREGLGVGVMDVSPAGNLISPVAVEFVRRNAQDVLWETWTPALDVVGTWGGVAFVLQAAGLSNCRPDQICTTQEGATLALTSATVVTPEPGTWLLVGSGLLAVGGIATRRRRI